MLSTPDFRQHAPMPATDKDGGKYPTIHTNN
jgi:hypothetical protein